MKKLFLTLMLVLALPASSFAKDGREGWDEFWGGFKEAVAKDEREKVASEYVNYPLKDNFRRIYNGELEKKTFGESLTAFTKEEFLKNYDKLFTDELKKKIADDRYVLYCNFYEEDENMCPLNEFIIYTSESPVVFRKYEGKFHIDELPYQE